MTDDLVRALRDLGLLVAGSLLTVVVTWIEGRRQDRREHSRREHEGQQRLLEWRRLAYVAFLQHVARLEHRKDRSLSVEELDPFHDSLQEILLLGPQPVRDQAFRLLAALGEGEDFERVAPTRRVLRAKMRDALSIEDYEQAIGFEAD
jgi:hypothetical protein